MASRARFSFLSLDETHPPSLSPVDELRLAYLLTVGRTALDPLDAN
jgi:hypothetical protein